MKRIKATKQFKKDIKKIQKRGKDLTRVTKVIELLEKGTVLEEFYRDHSLHGDYEGYRECHVEPDWLLIYKVQDDTIVLILYRTGSHSDLFH